MGNLSYPLAFGSGSGGSSSVSSGLYSARPTAATAGANAVYYATDVQEGYISNGSSWTVIPSGGTELAYAEITTSFTTTSTSPVDVTGLSVSCAVGERPVNLVFSGAIGNTVTGAYARLFMVANGVSRVFAGGPSAVANEFRSYHRSYRVSGLTPGTVYTFKVQLASVAGGGTSSVYGDTTTDRASIAVVTT